MTRSCLIENTISQKISIYGKRPTHFTNGTGKIGEGFEMKLNQFVLLSLLSACTLANAELPTKDQLEKEYQFKIPKDAKIVSREEADQLLRKKGKACSGTKASPAAP